MFQGEAGGHSHKGRAQGFSGLEAIPAHAFEDAFGAVREGRAGRAMIPIENSVAGRVADMAAEAYRARGRLIRTVLVGEVAPGG